MATLKADSPGQRGDAGDALLQAAAQVDTRPIAVGMKRFTGAHGKYAAAQKRVAGAEDNLRDQQRKLAEADVVQDDAVELLAVARISDGARRTHPFADLGFKSPSNIKQMGYEAEAQTCLKLSAAVKKAKGCTKGTTAAASAVERSAKAVLAASKPIAKLAKARTDAISARSALEQEWETAFAALKRAARSAEDSGASGLYAALFERTVRATSKQRKKGSADGAASTPADPLPSP